MSVTAEKQKCCISSETDERKSAEWKKKKSRAAFSDVSPNDRSVKSLKWAFFFLKYDMWISVAYVPHTPTPNSVQT